MKKKKSVIKLLKGEKRKIKIALCNRILYTGIANKMDDEAYLKMMFKIHFNESLDLVNPTTFSEKMQWLKLYDRNPDYVEMVDKIAVKNYITRMIGNQYIIPTLGQWDDFDEIDFDQLPNQFVLKCNHDSGSAVICHDKQQFDKVYARKKLMRCLKRDHFWINREWPYHMVKRKIMAETFLEDKNGLNDYKFLCFNGVVRCSYVASERFSDDGLKVNFYDREWDKMPFERLYPSSSVEFDKPKNYDEMIALSEELSQGILFVRVDFYEVEGKVYFGELTFFPDSGWGRFNPNKWDAILGGWLDLKG